MCVCVRVEGGGGLLLRTNDGTDHQMNSQPENTADMERL